jgi:hypothetical protein
MNGPGQRPQAYCSLEHPSERELKKWEVEHNVERRNDNRDPEVLKLYPGKEKTPRGTFHPGIVFPDEARGYFLQYARLVRPAIMRNSEAGKDDVGEPHRPWLVHTKNGAGLRVLNLRGTLRTYVSGVGGLQRDLSFVTPMSLRASYASLLFQAYRDGQVAEDMTTERFLSELAEVMNTSPDMLRTTYIATNGKAFDAAARAFSRALSER